MLIAGEITTIGAEGERSFQSRMKRVVKGAFRDLELCSLKGERRSTNIIRRSYSRSFRSPLSPSYSALKASAHLLYEVSISTETLGFLSSNV